MHGEDRLSHLLHIQSSPNLESSVTRRLSGHFVKTWCASRHQVTVEEIDLAASPLPHFGPEIMAAYATQPSERTKSQNEAIALSEQLVSQLVAADILVVSAPMINFTIPTQLKAWFDYVIVAGKTFQYAAPGVAKGLLFGKKAFVIEARGGEYAEGPASAFDFQEPLLRTMLGFMGIFDVTFIRAEGMRQKPEDTPAIIAHAEQVVARLAA
jgi:FMN-dependent NADH-azoreductase